jgi:small subunit ribosomal protein S16
MALKIRLRQQGRRNRLVYRLVLSDARSPRDGKYLEILGWYNPHETEAERSLKVDASRIQHWIDQGAELTEKAGALVKKSAPEILEALSKKKEAAKKKAAEKKRELKKKRVAALA